MRQRLVYLILIISVSVITFNACNSNNLKTEEASYLSTYPTKALTLNPTLTSSPTLIPHDNRIKQFVEDAVQPIDFYEKFTTAIQGDASAQEWFHEYESKNMNFSFINGVFPYGNNKKALLENECYYNIGMLYYYGHEGIPLNYNKEKAFYWLNLSADKGSFFGAIVAGDMAQNGDGIDVNEKMAFDLYKKALAIKINEIAYERLAYCYENGIGTNIDEEKAKEYYFKSTLDGNKEALYKLSYSNKISPKQSLLFSKAASSMDYSASYFDMVYGGLNGYNESESKIKVIEHFNEIWNNGTDSVSVQLKKSIREDKYFSKAFVEELIKTSYTYSYHNFAKKYGIKPNCSYQDKKNIRFDKSDLEDESNYVESTAKRYLDFEECEFYELDFDGDGEDEIGIPLHSGAGGAFMMDSFGIFKRSKEGFYKIYSGGPNCTMRDAMRLIKYNGNIYFITNPYSDTKNAPHDITAYVIDENGEGHEISVNCTEYKPKEIMTKVYDKYNTDEFYEFIADIKDQAYEAISSSKKHEMYNPNTMKPLTKETHGGSYRNDVYFKADIHNDGTEEFIRKAHIIVEDKYYNDYNLFETYDKEPVLYENAKSLLISLPYDEYYGLHSFGNIYDVLPAVGKIVQFWTVQKDKNTFCIALTRNELIYSLQVYTVQNKTPIPVCDSLFFDEVQDIEIIFSQD